MRESKYNLPCNIAQTLNIIGDRWTLLIVHEIMVGRTTFNEMKKGLDGISSNLLSDRLKHLEQTGLIHSSLYSSHPPRYEYKLTESGKELDGVFNAIILWGRNNLEKCYKKIIHKACQNEIELAYYCHHCQKNVDELEVIELSSTDDEPVNR
ncbi:winged helix-turn-helix transcriptional regulator [Mesobacillus harenae]|uniref:winged helix-turn-helix transcriptional regulator n=1 Tax=Mesobacillus harenae TaxID=2213203 RepID=UPI001580DF5C|nr:helix-turn-helix domain-containing protein [Mesobacillus harenae]